MSRAAELARARAFRQMSEEDCLVWLGVGLATLERVEAGEIVPSLELEQRIDRYLQVCGVNPSAAALPERGLSHSHAPSCGGADVTGPAAFPGSEQ